MATATKTKDDTQQLATPQGSPPATTEGRGKAPHPLVAFKSYVDQRMSELAYALPPHISPDRFTRVLLTALQRNPKLLACTRQSLWNACLLAAQDGLLPDGREGAIAPYGQNADGKRVAEIATWLPMIEGLRKKARNSGDILNWEAHIVRARDMFEVVLGDAPRIDHKPYIGTDEPGEIVAAYSIAWLKDGAISREVMTKRDLDKVRAKSKASRGPWNDPDFAPEMYRKTVARRHYKQLPHSSDLDAMIARDDEAFGLDDRTEDQVEQRQQRRVASTAAAFDQFAGDGQVIDHDTEPSQTQDQPSAGDDFGEFEDGKVEDQATEPVEGKQPEPEKKKAEPEKKPEPDKKQAEAKPEGWPLDKKPTTSAEYLEYVKAKVAGFEKDSTFTINVAGEDTVVTGQMALVEWFKSKAERDLRTACKVQKEDFDKAKIISTDRINALKKAG